MNTIPVLTKTVLDDIRYVGKSYEWLQMADKELSRKKNWSFGDYAAAILSLANFGYSVYKTIDDGGKLLNCEYGRGYFFSKPLGSETARMFIG